MKNNLIAFATVLLTCAAVTCGVFAGENQVAKMLPENTECMIKIGSVKKLFDSLSVTENSIMGRPVKDLESAKARFGFNPYSVKEWAARGFDTGREVGIALGGISLNEEKRKANLDVSFMLPVSDSKKAVGAFQTLLKNVSPEIQYKTEGKMTAFHETAGIKGGQYAVKDNYLVVGFSETSGAKPFMESLLAGKSPLPKTGSFKDVAKKLDPGADVFAYFNVNRIVNNNLDKLKNMAKTEAAGGQPGQDNPADTLKGLEKELELLKDFEGAGLAFNFGNRDFQAKSVFNMVPGSKSAAAANGLKFNKKTVLGIDEPAMLVLSSAINVSEYGQTLSDSDSAILNNVKNTLQTQYGIDFDKEIKDNLEGNLNLGVYDGMSINMMSPNALMTLNLKDEAAMLGVIEKAFTNLPEEKKAMIQKRQLAGHDAYVFNMAGLTQLYIGVKDKNLIVAAGKSLFEKAVKAGASQGFAGKLADRKLADQLKGDTGMLYLDFSEVFAAVSNFLPMITPPDKNGNPRPVDERFRQAAEKFRYLLTTARPQGNALHLDLAVKTKFAGPFFKGLAEIVKSFEEKPATDKTQG